MMNTAPHDSGQSMDAVTDAIRRAIHGECVGVGSVPPGVQSDFTDLEGECEPIDPNQEDR